MNEVETIQRGVFALFTIGLFVIVALIVMLGNASQYKYWARRRELENEELREQMAFDQERRERAQAYFLNKVHTHDQEVIDYAIEKKLGLLNFSRRETEPQQKRPLNINYNNPPPSTRREPPRTTPQRQPETRVVFVHAAQREEPKPRKPLLSFWRDDDDDVIDIEPVTPTPTLKAAPQAPLLGTPRNKGGRPRKYATNADRQRNYNQRKREKS